MQLVDPASAIGHEEGDWYWYVYHGWEGEIIPADATRVIIHPSVRAIKDGAFYEHEISTFVTFLRGSRRLVVRHSCTADRLKGSTYPTTSKRLNGRPSIVALD